MDPLALVAVDQMKKRNLVKCLVQIQILSSLLPSLVSALRSNSWVFGFFFPMLSGVSLTTPVTVSLPLWLPLVTQSIGPNRRAPGGREPRPHPVISHVPAAAR